MAQALAAKLLAKGKKNICNGNIDWVADIAAGNIKFALITDSWTPKRTLDEFFSTIGNEASDASYTAGGKVLSNGSISMKTLTVTFTNATNLVTSAGHGLKNGDTISFSSTGAVPTGLTADTDYYVISATTDTFQLSLTAGGAAVTFTADGTGTITGNTSVIVFDCDDPATFTALSAAFKYGLIYKVGTAGVSDYAIAYQDYGAQTPSAQDTTISFNAGGAFVDRVL